MKYLKYLSIVIEMSCFAYNAIRELSSNLNTKFDSLSVHFSPVKSVHNLNSNYCFRHEIKEFKN